MTDDLRIRQFEAMCRHHLLTYVHPHPPSRRNIRQPTAQMVADRAALARALIAQRQEAARRKAELEAVERYETMRRAASQHATSR